MIEAMSPEPRRVLDTLVSIQKSYLLCHSMFGNNVDARVILQQETKIEAKKPVKDHCDRTSKGKRKNVDNINKFFTDSTGLNNECMG